jgi:hypothetical protein
MNPFVTGAIFMGLAIVGLYFLRFWRRTSDPLFAFFAAAFGIMALGRVVLSVIHEPQETRANYYLVRLLAFVLILLGIVYKNRRR